jgi:hypothetical protein
MNETKKIFVEECIYDHKIEMKISGVNHLLNFFLL